MKMGAEAPTEYEGSLPGDETTELPPIKIDLVERLFNTPIDRMSELTFIPKGQAAEIARAMTMAEMFNPDRHVYEWRQVNIKGYAYDIEGNQIIDADGQPVCTMVPAYDDHENPIMERVMVKYVTLLEIFLMNYFKVLRSVDGKFASFAVMLGETQADVEEEEPIREY